MRGMGETLASWSQEEFGRANISDPRWGRRLVRMGAVAARGPSGRITETFSNDAERQGAYGLLETKAVAPEQISESIFDACARRCADEEFVFCPVDGSSLTMTDWGKSKDFGLIGSRTEGGRGIKVMNAIALSPSGVPLGVCSQRWWNRPVRKPRRKNRDQLPPEEKETRYWLEAMQQTREVMAAHAPDTKCWFQLDREGDAWPTLMDAGVGDHYFTVRAAHNRRVRLPSGRRGKLKTYLARQPVAKTYELQVLAAKNRAARTARVELRACPMTLEFRDKRNSRRFSKTLNVVQVLERGTTPRGEKPIQWILLSNRPIETIKDLTDIVFGYSLRWRVEDLHRTWKRGACKVEETQLRSTSAVIKWATILVAVAIRIERIKHLAREEPDRPATDEFTPLEIKAAAFVHLGAAGKKRLTSGAVPTIAEVTEWIAKIGGYTGRTSSGGPPGSTTLARGLKSIRPVVKALEAMGQQ